LELMKKLVKQYKKSLPIRQLAVELTNGFKQKDYIAEIRAVHKFVRDRIRYVKDIRGVETVQTPLKTLEIGSGDCDDKATLAGALLEALGHRTRFVAIGFRPGIFQHVYLETTVNSPSLNQWLALETTEPWPLGKKAQGEVNKMIVYN
jgi:transglutaminase-like putative cysteine protease